MNSELAPALLAAGTGSAMLAGIHLWERKQTEAMRASMSALSLRFPNGLEPSAALAAWDGLAGLPHTIELIAEVAAREGQLTHSVWAPAAVSTSVQSTMTGAIASLRTGEAAPSPTDAVTLSLRLFIAAPTILSDENAVSTSRSLLTALAGLRSGEHVIIRFALRPGAARARRETQNPSSRQRDIERAWQRKADMAGFSVSG